MDSKLYRHLCLDFLKGKSRNETMEGLFRESLNLVSNNVDHLDVNDIPDHLLGVWVVDISGLEYWNLIFHVQQIEKSIPIQIGLAYNVFLAIYVKNTGLCWNILSEPSSQIQSLHEDFFLNATLFQDNLGYALSERRQGRRVPSFDVMDMRHYLDYNINHIPQTYVSEWRNHSEKMTQAYPKDDSIANNTFFKL